ncbi:hypothetical protein D8674_032779 [Pyrus ussuriensis x Pyrus communis]|uniref:Uncharacterized protein n=1 Tax=Pyrus ussuriensis x Pyrus communis TaxID=2448454 RepID=A0A5N5HX64_9ROSA|nr:hypothetical protein D8674_032779 [Pyrus ussuriensis x Pyrus communis]
MSELITRRPSVTNAPPALAASTAPAVSAPLIKEPTPLLRLLLRRPRCPSHRRHQCPFSSLVHGGLIGATASQILLITLPWHPKSRVRPPNQIVIYDLEDISPETMAYLEKTFVIRYKQWKNNFHMYFKRWDNPKIACLHVPTEFQDRLEDWEWLCKHFTDPEFVVSRALKTLLHHSGSKPFCIGLRHDNLGRHFRCIGKAWIRETGASSSRSNTTEVDALKEEVTTLKGQLAIQEEQMKAQGKQMRAQMMAQSELMGRS